MDHSSIIIKEWSERKKTVTIAVIEDVSDDDEKAYCWRVIKWCRKNLGSRIMVDFRPPVHTKYRRDRHWIERYRSRILSGMLRIIFKDKETAVKFIMLKDQI